MIVRHLIHDKRQIHPYSLTVGARTGSALCQRNVVVEHARRHSVGFGLFLCFAHQRGEGGQRGKLTVGEEVGIVCHSVIWCLEVTRICRQCGIGKVIWTWQVSNGTMVTICRQIYSPRFTFGYNSHEP